MTEQELAWLDLKGAVDIPSNFEEEGKALFFAGIAWAYSRQREAADAGLEQLRECFERAQSSTPPGRQPDENAKLTARPRARRAGPNTAKQKTTSTH